ncbi:hypothetical protein I4U23_010405 [Adineta vaga]|nr:hypothetical protein I4U23_010405 [Adineta vaga]
MNHIQQFTQAWEEYIQHPHLAHGSYSMTILDAQTGSILFEHAKDVAHPPASSMKTITAAAALHYLGPDYVYETSLQYSHIINKETGVLDGYIYIVGSGDPSLGSSRFDETINADFIMKKWVEIIKQTGIRKCRGVIGDTSRWKHTETMLSNGWTWNDIGHSYGTGHSALNWRENEFTIELQPNSSINELAHIIQITNPPPQLEIINELITSSSSSDVFLSFSLNNPNIAYLRGVLAINTPPNFSLHCAVPNSALYIANELTQILRIHGIEIEQEAQINSNEIKQLTLLDIHQSPPLSKLLQPFLRESINMYAEVFIKTIAYQTQHCSLIDAPLTILPLYIKTLFNTDNVLSGMTLTDGSGLSRTNRLSTYVLARILLKIQKESWFNDVFYEALPIINELRMKSGTLLNTIAYAGYVRENSFVFSFMIDNYHGESAPEMRKKIWNVLDTLK